MVLVLFSDASRIGLHPLRAGLTLCLRLLGIGLPLAIGAALAPTDAGLGAGMMVNRAVQGQNPAADQRRERA